MVKYHIATGDGKAYYGVNYESYREAEAVLRFSQKHDPQAHIVEEEYHFTNADRIRAMSDDELAKFVAEKIVNIENHKMVEQGHTPTATQLSTLGHTMYCILMRWLREPAEGE